MLIHAVYLITILLVSRIARAKASGDAVGYLIASGIIPLPVVTLGNSVNAGLFPVDICLLTFLIKHGSECLRRLGGSRRFSGGRDALFGLACLATLSGTVNFLFINQAAWTFYGFTMLKFWEYCALATVVVLSRPNQAQLRDIGKIMLVSVLLYETLHVLHLGGILPLSGSEYFGPRAADFAVDMDSDQKGSGAAAFSDRSAWFLTSYRIVIGGTASVNACMSVFLFETSKRAVKALAGLAVILSMLSILATSSRSDIAGIIIACLVFVLLSPRQRWATYARAVVTAGGLYGALLSFVLPQSLKDDAVQRMSEFWNSDLRSEGDYASRAYDRAAMIRYLPDHIREFLIGAGPGNYQWYASQRITMNSFGHNSYLHWTGELGAFGLLFLVCWCLAIGIQLARLAGEDSLQGLSARAGLALLISRMVAAWGSESLFGTQGMGYYSMFFTGVLYFLLAVSTDDRSINSN